MATPTREQVMTVLLAQLSRITDADGNPLKTCGRRLRDPENVTSDQRPALFLVEHQDHWQANDYDLPAIRIMTVWAVLYTDVGGDENAIPMTQINGFIESIEAMLDPSTDNPNGGYTLNDLVRAVQIAGEGVRAAGDTTGKSVAAIPLRIVIP